MQISKLDPRTRLSIEMALAGDRSAPALIRQQDDAAARIGMCGAEIDAARAGRSFDVRGGHWNWPLPSSAATIAMHDHVQSGPASMTRHAEKSKVSRLPMLLVRRRIAMASVAIAFPPLCRDPLQPPSHGCSTGRG